MATTGVNGLNGHKMVTLCLIELKLAVGEVKGMSRKYY